MKSVPKNVAASVHQRLKNAAKDSGRSFNDLSQYYALERWLYRLSRSRYSQAFILKGALMLVAWKSPILRATRDIDLLGRIENDPEKFPDALGLIRIFLQPVICSLAEGIPFKMNWSHPGPWHDE